jgi:anti-sigma regulatory factor (Ser/Thr protein kinase)
VPIQVTLPPDTESPSRARHFVCDALSGREAPLDVVALLVSEVVTNAVLHARSEVTLTVRIDNQSVRVEVADRSAAVPEQRPFTDDAVTGRGMYLVEQLADHWGTDPAADGKVVWFELVHAA